MRRDQIEELARSLAEEVCRALGLFLVDCTYRKSEGVWRIAVKIDRAQGVSIDDCAEVSRMLSDKFDEADPIEHQYVLEVSSAGLSDPLKTDQDLQRFIGRQIEIDLHPPRRQGQAAKAAGNSKGGRGQTGSKPQPQQIVGTLVTFSPGVLTVEVAGEVKQVDRGSIRRARPAVDFRGVGEGLRNEP